MEYINTPQSIFKIFYRDGQNPLPAVDASPVLADIFSLHVVNIVQHQTWRDDEQVFHFTLLCIDKLEIFLLNTRVHYP